MDKFRFLVQLPFLAHLLMPLAAMGLPVYQINRRGIGTLRVDAHRIKPSAWRSAFRTQLSAWRALFAKLLPIAAAVILMLALSHVLPDQPGVAMAVTPIAIKQLKQEKADNARAIADCEAKQATLRKEARGIFAITADRRTEAQAGRLTAIDAELDALVASEADLKTKASTIASELQRAERYADANTGGPSPLVETGRDYAESAPWVPEAAAAAASATNAPEYVKREVRHMALGNFALAVRAASMGVMDPRLQAAATGGGTQSDSNLGFAVPKEVAPGIEREMYEQGEILSRCDIRTIGGNAITYNRFDETSRADGSRQGGVLGYWVDEGTAPTASNMKLDKLEMKLRKVGALGVLTDELLSDAIALGGELEEAFSVELIFQTENKVYRGNGSSAPLGFLAATNVLVSVAKETGQAAATIVSKNLSKMWARMPARSQKNAVWLYNVDCGPQLDELSIPSGTAALEPRFVRYNEAGLLTIKGRPAIAVEYAESCGTQGDIALVDLKRYRLIRKGGVEQASSMHVYFAQGEQAFRAFYRVDGKPVPKAAVTPFKGSATLSPFVVLDTRS